MDEVERLVRTIFHHHGQTRKIPLEEMRERCYDYEEGHIIQKLLYHHELREHMMEKGYTHEQAEKMISESVLRGIIDKKSRDPDSPKKRDKNKYVMANEEYWVEEEFHDLGYTVLEELMESEVKDYVLEFPFDWNDEDEEKLREVYYEHNIKELSKSQLIKALMGKGYTEKQAEELLERYTTIEIEEEERNGWNEDEKLFRRPEYKPLRYHKDHRIFKRADGEKGTPNLMKDKFIVLEIPHCYEIMQLEEWELQEYQELIWLRDRSKYIYGTKKVPFKTIRKILREAEKQGRKTLTHSELKQRIMEECKATEEEAKTAIHGAEITFKIRAVTPTLQKVWNLEPYEGVEYYWSGTTLGYPPFTLQDRVFNPIVEALREAEEEGKEALPHEELVQKVYQSYQEHKLMYESIPRTIEKEFVETVIADAEELLLITAARENGKTKYRLNHQILKQPKPKTKTNKHINQLPQPKHPHIKHKVRE